MSNQETSSKPKIRANKRGGMYVDREELLRSDAAREVIHKMAEKSREAAKEKGSPQNK